MQPIEFPVPNLGEHNDLTDTEFPLSALRVSQNMMRNERGRLVIRPGYTTLATTNPGGRIMGIHHFRTATGDDKQMAANKTGVWQFDGSDWVSITGAAMTGTNFDHVRFETFSVAGVFSAIIMNGKDAIQTWPGTGTCTTLSGSPPIAIDGAACSNRMLWLVAPNKVHWTGFNDPTSNGVNDFAYLVDSGDIMVGIERFNRTSAVVMGDESQWLARAQSGSTPFRFEKVSERPGPLSTAAMVRAAGAIFYLAEDSNVYKFDGVSCEPVGWAMKPWVYQHLNSDNRKMSHGVYMEQIGKVWFFFPGKGKSAPNLGVSYDVRTGEMSRLSFGAVITASGRVRAPGPEAVIWSSMSVYPTWDDMAAAYPSWESFGGGGASERVNLLGDISGNVHIIGQGSGSDNGASIEAIFELPLKAYGTLAKAFTPSTFDTFFRKTTNSTIVEMALGYTDTLMSDPVYVPLGSFDLSTDQRNSIDLASVSEKRFISIRHRTTASYGQVEYLGGLLFGEEVNIDEGPTHT